MQTKLNRELTAEEGIDNSLLKIDSTKKLGQGGFGIVYQGKYRGKDVAAKQILDALTPETQREFESEARIMLQLRDPSVLHLYGVTKGTPRYMVLEYCPLGSLDKYLHSKKREDVSWELRFHLATGIASGLEYLHTYNPMIIHGDLKSLNVLLTGDPIRPDTKLADFGMSKLKTETQTRTNDSRVDKGWSVQWAAPELFSLRPKKTSASDMYAFGITLWEMTSHDYPYRNVTGDMIQVLIKGGERAEIPGHTPPLFAKVMTACWSQKPDDRLSAKAVLDELQAYQAVTDAEKVDTPKVNIVSENPSVLSDGFLKSSSHSRDSNHSPIQSQFLNSSKVDTTSRGSFSSHSNENTASTSSTSSITNFNSSPFSSDENTAVIPPLLNLSAVSSSKQGYLQEVKVGAKAVENKNDAASSASLSQASSYAPVLHQSTKSNPMTVNTQQQAKQDELIRYLQAGNLEAVKKLELEGVSFLYSDKKGEYPLVAAVYEMNLDAVRYVEGKLNKEQAAFQWSNVDAEKMKREIASEMPKQLRMDATYDELASWYENNVGMRRQKKVYDEVCLTYTGCTKWIGGENWSARGSEIRATFMKVGVGVLKSTLREQQFDLWKGDSLGGRSRVLYWAGRAVHDKVVKQIRDQLNALKKEVEAKAAQQPSSSVSTRPNSSSTAAVHLTSASNVDTSLSPSPFGRVFHLASPATSQQAALTSMQQVQATSKEVQDKIDPQELAALLKLVTEGHLEEVEKLLKKNANLGLGTGTVTDRSDRTFKHITVLQYAAWALDTEMVELIMKYVGVHNTSIQLKALGEEHQTYSSYGASYDVKPLVKKYQTYIDNCSQWYEDQCGKYWQKEIGGEQRKCPAWLIYAWCEEGENVAWIKQDPHQKIKREYDKHRLNWWFTQNYNDGQLGKTCVIWRKSRERCLVDSRDMGTLVAKHDQKCISDLGRTRRETLDRLKATVNRELNPTTSLNPSITSTMNKAEHRSPTPY